MDFSKSDQVALARTALPKQARELVPSQGQAPGGDGRLPAARTSALPHAGSGRAAVPSSAPTAWLQPPARRERGRSRSPREPLLGFSLPPCRTARGSRLACTPQDLEALAVPARIRLPPVAASSRPTGLRPLMAECGEVGAAAGVWVLAHARIFPSRTYPKSILIQSYTSAPLNSRRVSFAMMDLERARPEGHWLNSVSCTCKNRGRFGPRKRHINGWRKLGSLCCCSWVCFFKCHFSHM